MTLKDYVQGLSYPLRYPAIVPYADMYTVDPEKAEEWLQAHKPEHRERAQSYLSAINRISHEAFLEQLQRSVENLELLLEGKEFVLVIPPNSQKKSNSWVTSIVLSFFKKLPLDVLEVDEKSAIPPVKNLVYCDDAAYSGEQVAQYFNSTLKGMGEHEICFLIPFMTKHAYTKLKSLGPNVTITNHAVMPVVKELPPFSHLDIHPKQTLTIFAHKIGDDLSVYRPNVLKEGALYISPPDKTRLRFPFLRNALDEAPYKWSSDQETTGN